MDEERLSVEEFVVGKVTALDLPFPMRPNTQTELPRDVTTLSPADLMRWMNHFTNLTEYARWEAAKAGLKTASKKAASRFHRAKKYLTLQEESSKKITIKQLEYMLDCDEMLDSLKQDEVEAEQYQLLVEALFEGYQAKYALLSRELTRRGYTGTMNGS